MYARHLEDSLRRALADTPVVLVNGARQVGKTTLVRRVSGRRYLNLDDATVLAAARTDPVGFLAGLELPVTLDEVQKAPELFPAIKANVDRRRRPGRFLLTGSTDVMLLPRLADSLAGRMEVLSLAPLSQGELEGHRESFIDAMFLRRLPACPTGTLLRGDLVGRIVRGGYPEAQRRRAASRRAAWFGSYLSAVLQRDVRDLSEVDGLTVLPRLLALLAARSSGTLNVADLSREAAVPQTSVARYLALLGATFLTHAVPAWSANLGTRLVKSPKMVLGDTGLACHLLGLAPPRLDGETERLGPLVESFVALELRKQLGWSRTRASLFHFRTHAGREVDLVLEDPRGRLAGVEVKAGATVRADDFRGLRALADAAGPRFVRGVVLYGGTEPIAFGARLHALPLDALWRLGVPPAPRSPQH